MNKNDDKISAQKRLKVYKLIMIVFDVLALCLFIYQLRNTRIVISSYIILVLCNVVVFMQKIK